MDTSPVLQKDPSIKISLALAYSTDEPDIQGLFSLSPG
jgi:hypothetical protein